MISKDVKRLLLKLNDPMTRALEGAAGLAVGRGHYEVTVEHLLLKLLEDGTGDAALALSRLGVEPGRVGKALTDTIEGYRTGNAGRPAFSPLLLDLVERAWVAGSVHHGLGEIRSGSFLEAYLESDALATSPAREAMSEAKADDLRDRFFELIEGSDENRASARGGRPLADASGKEGETALDIYTHSLTQQARDDGIDPIFGRDREIRQVIDVLSRRRKNNPILVGEAGVGKTAVVEGLALRIVAGDVPDSLKEAEIAALDLGALQAGAGVKGEFEARMKAVIDAVKDAPKPTILFIDEAHTLVGAGGAAGTGDAANLLKPALARGELRSVAATTWSEYKKHIEKDPALARRFQMVKVDEPDVETAVVMMRGVRDRYEDHHAVQITDAAVRAAVELSDRYLSGRQLPDKSVDLIDTASARVRMSQDATPAALDDLGRRLHEIETELTAQRRDASAGLGTGETLDDLEAERDRLNQRREALEARWKEEQSLARELEGARRAAATAGGDVPAGVRDLHARLEQLQEANGPLVHAEVGQRVVAEVIADWTGIPIGDMIKDEAQLLLELEDRLTSRIRGQDGALVEIADAIRTAKAGMRKADAPIGVFLLVGPSGVGKTETARALAELLFGGERFLVSINMSEYQESHTTSQLKGAPPGYVGYGEGGVLTEAVRQRPYSVVLLDEVEKAHIDVMELFYQVFDRGILRDGEGREVDFSNTIILCTSNVGSDLVQQASMAEEAPTLDSLRDLIHEPLASHFQPALLGRMNTIPFLSLDRDAMAQIARLKLGKVDKRLRANHGIRFTFTDEVVETIADRCTTIDAGARNIDAIIDRTVLPEASRALLTRLAEENLPAALELGLDEAGNFTYTFVEPGERPDLEVAANDTEALAEGADLGGDGASLDAPQTAPEADGAALDGATEADDPEPTA
ncbi:type VI secretion system ATPase TssH [Rubrivirga marina]|uniref:ClpV1 family T6SS ATPase n=1 Tax=Rubrivirga marina TaxID=1196024 RepID=A0A271IYZ5_9BACT|nr:type VI secretion system ATPase TssH [Rubrivirga marina]PAP75729.1 ClpV1 family T6SS ATPase [Rubrivirga marina]